MSKDLSRLPRPLVEPIAGFIAGISSTCVSHPLDVVKTRLQLQNRSHTPAFGDSFRLLRDVFRHEGAVRGLYRGLTPNLVGNSTSWALYFACYDRIKRQMRDPHVPSDVQLSYHEYFLASGAAGVITSLCTNPIWVVKTRMLSTSSRHPGAYSTMIDGIRQIYKDDGLRGFYRGLLPSLFGVTHGALQFMAYERLKAYRTRTNSASERTLGSADYLVLSGLAKMFAGSTTYPYQVIRARLQMYEVDRLYSGARDVMLQIWRLEGIAGFYKGLGPNLLRVLPSTWVTFLVYEKTRQQLS